MFTPAKLKVYRKALVAALGVLLTGVNVVYGNDPRVQLVIALAVTYGVYQVPNKK